MEGKTNIEEAVSEEAQKFSLGHELFEWVYTIVIAVAIALVVKTFVFDIVQVDGASMFPTLTDGDRLIVQKIGYSPKCGDIVILDSNYKKRGEYYKEKENETGKSMNAVQKGIDYLFLPKDLKTKYYVKRVIAEGGQTVDLRGGRVYVDGERLEEEYYNGVTQITDATNEFPQTVREGYVFVMGDNRPRSLDSRDSHLGQVPLEAVVGASRFRIWPINNVGVTK